MTTTNNNDITIRELEDYIDKIALLQFNKSSEFFGNTDALHANLVIQRMLKSTTKEFFIFDNNMDGDIADALDNQNFKEEEVKSFLSKNSFIDTLSDFFKNGKKLYFLLTEDVNSVNSPFKIIIDFFKIIYSDQIVIHKVSHAFIKEIKNLLNMDFYFATNDNDAVRIEETDDIVTNEKYHAAACSFNKPELSQKLIDISKKELKKID